VNLKTGYETTIVDLAQSLHLQSIDCYLSQNSKRLSHWRNTGKVKLFYKTQLNINK